MEPAGMGLWLGLLIGLAGLVVGVALGVAGLSFYRVRVQSLRNARTHRQLEGDRVSNVAQMLHFAIQSGPDAVVVVDRRQTVVLTNPRAHELGLVHDRDLNPEVWAVVSRVLGDHEPRTLRFVPPRRRGNRPVMSVAGQAKLLSLADARYVVVYATDDSEHVRMESARRDFVANVSHELKTPVGAISLLVETMMETRDDPEAVGYFGGKLTVETQRMNQMITELISLSKLQGAESLPAPEILSVDRIVEEGLDRCRLAASAVDIELVKDAKCNAMVRGDMGLLVTSLSNLITNAIHYSPRGSTVSVSRQATEDTVTIRVTDRGIGIAPENQQRVFERFFRVDKARARNTGGTGLGLAIVKHVMANHGGSVSLWSQPGTGSTFTLELPRVSEDAAVDGEEPPAEDPVIPGEDRLAVGRTAGVGSGADGAGGAGGGDERQGYPAGGHSGERERLETFDTLAQLGDDPEEEDDERDEGRDAR